MSGWTRRDNFLTRTNLRKMIEHLTDEQAGKIYKFMLKFAETGELDEADDPMVAMVLDLVVADTNESWRRYDRRSQENAQNGKVGGIISRLREGRSVSEDSIAFLREQGCLTREYLERRGVPEAIISTMVSGG